MDRTGLFLINFLLLLFFYRLSFSKQTSNDLLTPYAFSLLGVSKDGAKVVLLVGLCVPQFWNDLRMMGFHELNSAVNSASCNMNFDGL